MSLNVFTDRLKKLRDKIQLHQVNGFLVPHADRFQNEYIQQTDNYLEWLTGFTGSAGLAVVLENQAALFVDGRYTLQASEQVDTQFFSVEPYTLKSIAMWLEVNCSNHTQIFYDPWIHTIQQIQHFEAILKPLDIELIPCPDRFFVNLATDRSPYQFFPFQIHNFKWSGQNFQNKLQIFISELEKNEGDYFIVCCPQSISWTLNIRCESNHYNPACPSYVIIDKEGKVTAFAALENISKELEDYTQQNILWLDINKFEDYLSHLKEKKVLLDPALVPNQVFLILKKIKSSLLLTVDPSILPRALKNQTEQEGMENVHKKDGAAVVNSLAWLDQEIQSRTLTELEAADYILKQRQKQNEFRGESFAIVSAAGSHGAVVHYKPTVKTNAVIKPDMLYLIDSGGHYNDGTTDITRTIAIGIPSSEQKDRYTRVLKGHIALAQAVFPKGTTGHQLDILARQFLWQVGLDYDHGTGHGVGSYLNVHEGPHQISKRMNSVGLQPGMVVTNEPGYYKKNEYGIRLENIMLVMPAQTDERQDMLGFKTLTLVPFDQRLIDISMLTDSERQWVNNYHQRIKEELYMKVDPMAQSWLTQATEKL